MLFSSLSLFVYFKLSRSKLKEVTSNKLVNNRPEIRMICIEYLIKVWIRRMLIVGALFSWTLLQSCVWLRHSLCLLGVSEGCVTGTQVAVIVKEKPKSLKLSSSRKQCFISQCSNLPPRHNTHQAHHTWKLSCLVTVKCMSWRNKIHIYDLFFLLKETNNLLNSIYYAWRKIKL